MIWMWIRGLLRRRTGRLLAAAAGIGVAVALLACLGSFLAHGEATMTDRAVRDVDVDWQVQVQPGADTGGGERRGERRAGRQRRTHRRFRGEQPG